MRCTAAKAHEHPAERRDRGKEDHADERTWNRVDVEHLIAADEGRLCWLRWIVADVDSTSVWMLADPGAKDLLGFHF